MKTHLKYSIHQSNVTLSEHNFQLEYHIFQQNLAPQGTCVREYLQLFNPSMDDEQVHAWLGSAKITLDTKPASLETPLSANQKLSIYLTEHFEQNVDCRWKALWENDQLMAVYKPAPLAVSRTTRNLYSTLINLVRRQTPYPSAQLLHRLDIETSGVILITKDKTSDSYWKPKIKSLIEEKVYHAIVHGAPQWQNFSCDTLLVERLDSEIRCKMHVVDDTIPETLYKKPKLSKTLFTRLNTQGDYSLIECRLLTGRKHQIRAQLAHLGHPIVGDKIYAHQGHYFLKRLASEHGLTASDYRQLKSTNHLLRAVRVGLRLSPDAPLVSIACPSFNKDLTKEFFEHSED